MKLAVIKTEAQMEQSLPAGPAAQCQFPCQGHKQVCEGGNGAVYYIREGEVSKLAWDETKL